MLPESVSAVLYVANVVAVVHMVADNVVCSHVIRRRSAPVRSGASQFALWASADSRLSQKEERSAIHIAERPQF